MSLFCLHLSPNKPGRLSLVNRSAWRMSHVFLGRAVERRDVSLSSQYIFPLLFPHNAINTIVLKTGARTKDKGAGTNAQLRIVPYVTCMNVNSSSCGEFFFVISIKLLNLNVCVHVWLLSIPGVCTFLYVCLSTFSW